jgi:predicted acyltransferase
MPTVSRPAPPKAVAAGTGRLLSLDVFRGAAIASMMLVNNPGSWSHVYEQLDHAEWNGWTFTDVIFPFFLWIVGVAVPLSTSRRIERGEGRRRLFLHAVRRAAILFGLGLFLAFFSFTINGSYAKAGGFAGWWHEVWTTIRISGVLQRIAVCYLIATTIYLCAKVRGQIAWTVGLLAVYWLVMKLAPTPGYGPGVLTPKENFSAYVDGLVLGRHTWKGMPWDPEGILSTIPAVATCLFGILTGQLLLIKRSVEQKTGWLFVAGNLLMAAGALMNIWLPINKNLWTSSYAVFMAGLAIDVFAVLYWLVDVKGYERWAKPFAVYGTNAITVFVLAGVLGRLLIEIKVPNGAGGAVTLKARLYDGWFAHLSGDPKISSLAWALVNVLGLYLVAYAMYRRKWFVNF